MNEEELYRFRLLGIANDLLVISNILHTMGLDIDALLLRDQSARLRDKAADSQPGESGKTTEENQ